MLSYTDLAKTAYAAYCTQAGGRTADGKRLPSFADLGGERQACWVAAAQAVAEQVRGLL